MATGSHRCYTVNVIDEALADSFRPEDRKRGADLVNKDAVIISSASDTSVKAMIRASSACRISFTADEVTSKEFRASCTCPTSRKGLPCKHMWAVLLKLEERDQDFIYDKTHIRVGTEGAKPAEDKQKQYRKQRYQQMKERAKERQGKAQRTAGPTYPESVAEARAYFLQNGFSLENMDLESLNEAKKILSRVFHPDKGGSHDEILMLNENFEVIRDYIKS